ncbi:ATP-grasp domain-containing protein [Micromonospora sp. WMMD712]|uniref:ATP-grasp domain-containing protein n=1 Tax=Micromonospora sp. WMMD712 TaxID=3016096 RepID=UPI00249CC21D|nr:ATP-grasp domain-containing protein [Micromonospora sp. WMMD712]WFE60467.1 ATP-grasp domain-containing protein [Micromonospora sp. WMMD712]
MDLGLGPAEMIVVGASLGTLRWLDEELPAGSVVVVEEPDVIDRRGVDELVGRLSVLARVVPAEYQTGFDADALLAREPELAGARLVMPGLEYAVGAAARLAARLGLPGAGAEAADVFSDKHRMRLLAAGAGLPNPAYALVGGPAEAMEFARRHGGRCVLKPTRRSGSLGVRLVADPAEIPAAWAATASPEAPPEATDRGLPTQVLAEQVLDGREHSVELLVADGEVIFGNVTDKRVLPGPLPVETGHTVPSALPGATRRDLLDAAGRLCAAAGFRTGVLHSEWIVVDGVPHLVECAARLPGDMITALISIGYEFGFIDAYLRVLRGERPALPARPTGAAAVEFLLAQPGTVTGIEGLRPARRVAGVLEVQLDTAVGATVAPVTSSGRRSGHVLAWGVDPAEAERAARAAAAEIRVTVA